MGGAEQQVMNAGYDGYGMGPYDTRIEENIGFFTTHPWAALVFAIGAVSCLVVAYRVFKNNPWVNEFLRMWRTR